MSDKAIDITSGFRSRSRPYLDYLGGIRIKTIFSDQNFLLFVLTLSFYRYFLDWVMPNTISNGIIFVFLFYRAIQSVLKVVTLLRLPNSFLMAAFFASLLLIMVDVMYSVMLGQARDFPYFVFITASQAAFPLLIINYLHGLSLKDLLSVRKYFVLMVMSVGLFSFAELLVPFETKIAIARFITKGKIGGAQSYEFTSLPGIALNFHRLGSVLFAPLTFGFLMALGFVYFGDRELSGRRKFRVTISGLALILSIGKSAIVIAAFSYASKLLRKLSIAIYIIPIVLLIKKIYEWYPILIEDGIKPNVLIHLSGLATGWNAALESPLFGKGFGTTTFLVQMECARLGIVGPFLNGGQNGLESTIGVFLYQSGFPMVGVLTAVYLWMTVYFFRQKQYGWSGLCVGYYFSMLLNESQISISIAFVFFYLIFCKIKINNRRSCGFNN